jgi:hypothetical protein
MKDIDQILENKLNTLLESINLYAADLYLMPEEMQKHEEKVGNILGSKWNPSYPVVNSNLFDTVQKLYILHSGMVDDFETMNSDCESAWQSERWSFE